MSTEAAHPDSLYRGRKRRGSQFLARWAPRGGEVYLRALLDAELLEVVPDGVLVFAELAGEVAGHGAS